MTLADMALAVANTYENEREGRTEAKVHVLASAITIAPLSRAVAEERERTANLLDKLAETFKTGTAQSVELAFDLARGEMLVLAEELRDNT